MFPRTRATGNEPRPHLALLLVAETGGLRTVASLGEAGGTAAGPSGGWHPKEKKYFCGWNR